MIIASATAAALVAGQIGAKASRDTLFLSNYPAADLPRVMLVAALFSLIASVLFAGLLRRQGPRLVIPALLVLSALLWAGEWSLYASQPRLVAELIFLHLATFGATVISGFWSVVNERFNPHEAKQVVARIVAGSTLGGAVGGLLTERTASVFGAPATLLLLALFSLGAAAGVWWLGGGEAPVVRADDPAVPPAPIGKTHSQRGYFTNLAILSLLVATLSALVEYGMKARAAEASPSAAELMQLFSYLYTGAALASFLTQVIAGRQTLERLGLGGALGLLPLLIALLSFATAIAGGLGLAAATSVVFSVISNSVYRAGYEILYTPVAPNQKRSLKMLIDVGATRAGDALGSGLILAMMALSGALAASVSSAIAGLVALFALAATYAVQRGYVRALAESLRRGVLAIDDSQIIDRTTRQAVTTHLDLDRARLLEDIRAHRAQELAEQQAPVEPPDPALARALEAFASGDERQISLLMGRRQLDPAIAPLVIRRLGNARHRPAARDYLLRFAAPLSGQLGDALLDRELPLETRLNCAAILTEAAPGRAIPALLAALEEPVFHLRAASACTLLELRRREQLPPEVGRRVLELVPRHLPGGALWSAVAPPALATEPGGGGPALEALLPGQADARLRLVFGLLATAHRPEPMIQAFRALASGEARLGGTALEYLDNVLSEELRKALTPLVSGPARLIGSSLAPPQEIKEIERSQSALRRSELSEPS